MGWCGNLEEEGIKVEGKEIRVGEVVRGGKGWKGLEMSDRRVWEEG